MPEISDQILGNIFYEGAPLHDGALVIRRDRAYAAGCVLPLTHDKSISKDLGTRHRAGIGITENSDGSRAHRFGRNRRYLHGTGGKADSFSGHEDG